ncbi:hypothetical protein CF165_48845 [Amycolatopsis vastitatis]|uniref:Uncharacterized protein n=1 Tax=Amycolatopsis vastitatis TaxID=1905142 RepID=A0A229SKF5_9PSEU|nr:hypothetical protein CF165_48845 [Amycolatopsis vastitatis]
MVQGVFTAAAGRLAERGVDRLLDGRRQTVVVPEPPKRHRLGDVTSDVDIVVRHRPAGQQVVLLVFQTASGWEQTEMPQGATVLMKLGETAHLTLPRDHYVISALVFEPPAKGGGKPVLHGIGRLPKWVLSNTTEQLAITTNPPSEKTLRKLGLLKPDGTSPFELPPAQPAAPPKQLPSAPPAARPSPPSARRPAGTRPLEALNDRPCQAALSRSGAPCPDRAVIVSRNSLCRAHEDALKQGWAVYDRSSGQQIR